MPRGDGMGPMGMGPMTGRGAGFCAGYATPGFMNPMAGSFGRGFGMGRGFGGGGRGRRNMFYATGMPGWQRAGMGYQAFGAAPWAAPMGGAPGPQMTDEQEVETLKRQADYFEEALENIKKRIGELAGK